MEIKNTYQYAWLCTFQLDISPNNDRKCQDIAGWGSGFFLSHKNRFFFVTADHNLHMDDHEQGERTGKENHLFIINNDKEKGEFTHLLTPLGNFNYFEHYDFSPLFQSDVNPDDIDPEVLAIPDLVDVAFCEVSDHIERPYLTHELRVGEEILVPSGEQKLIIPSTNIAEPEEGSFYLVESTVENKIKGLNNHRRNAIHQDSQYTGIKDGDYIFDYPDGVRLNEWLAISGAPFFDNRCRLIGMVIQANDHNNTIRVVPAHTIIKLINTVIEREEQDKIINQ